VTAGDRPSLVVSGSAGPPRAGVLLGRLLSRLDRLFDRLYGSRANPLYQSGTIAILCFFVTLVTGLYLFLFYKIADPHGSVAAIDGRIWAGGWVRSVHRYAADLALVAIAVHLLRKLVQGHTWGPRALAWLSGVALLALVLLCGWTGLVLVWDVQGQQVAVEGARLIDLAPVFSEPIERMFDGVAPVPSSFFFTNLFLHVALPLGLVVLLTLHLSRVARPALLPPRAIRRAVLAALALVALVAPVALPPGADLAALPGETPTDLFYAFWLPAAHRVPPAALALGWLLAFAALASLVRLWRPAHAILPSRVDEDHCTGCTNCYQDCPYEAIAMVPRERLSRQRSEFVARVDPALCVGCGICAASCSPMGVGPPGRDGREQLAVARAFADARRPTGTELALVACANGLGAEPELLTAPGRVPLRTGCSGSLHTSVVELLLRRGFAGVFVLTCAPRNCSFREGPKWLSARVFEGREAELSERVDRRRVAVAGFARGELAAARRALAKFERSLADRPVTPESRVELDAACDLDAARQKLLELVGE